MTDLRETVERTIAEVLMHRFIGAPTRRMADALLPIIPRRRP